MSQRERSGYVALALGRVLALGRARVRVRVRVPGVLRCRYARRVRFIGLDLAWGERARTGVAALDDAGHLVTCACVTTDDEIAAFAAEHAPGDCVLAKHLAGRATTWASAGR